MFAWVHLDDIFLVADMREKLHSILCKVVRELHMAGFNLALRKSQLEPTTILNYCGLTIDTCKAQFAVSTSKLKFFADLLVSPERFSKRTLGYLVFWVFALGLSSVARTLLRHHYRQLVLILKSGPWPLPPPEQVWACDASSNGMAVITPSQTIFKGSAFADHIFENELLALFVAVYFAPCRTLMLCDNQAVIRTMTHCSSHHSLIAAATTILLAKKNVMVQYIKSEWNLVDHPSRCADLPCKEKVCDHSFACGFGAP